MPQKYPVAAAERESLVKGLEEASHPKLVRSTHQKSSTGPQESVYVHAHVVNKMIDIATASARRENKLSPSLC